MARHPDNSLQRRHQSSISRTNRSVLSNKTDKTKDSATLGHPVVAALPPLNDSNVSQRRDQLWAKLRTHSSVTVVMEEEGPMSCPFCGIEADGDYQIMVISRLISQYGCDIPC
jgi:hypothetical protein